MKVALTLAAFAAAGMFASGDHQSQTPSHMPTTAKSSEVDFLAPRLPEVLPIELPTEPPDRGDDVGVCGCGGAALMDEPASDEGWDIDGCGTEGNDEIDAPLVGSDRVR